MDMFNLTRLKSALKRQLSLPVIQNPRQSASNDDDTPEDGKILSNEQPIVVVRSDKTRCSRRRRKSSSSRPALGVLEEIILCPLCKCKLRSPRTLACQHSFCKKCLDLELGSGATSPARCPSCRAPLGDLVSTELLPVNAGVAKLLEAVEREDFVERRVLENDDAYDSRQRRHSLVVNFRQLMSTPAQQSYAVTRPAVTSRTRERKISAHSSITIRCGNCRAPYCDAQDSCRHCAQIYCRACRELHAQQLDAQTGAIIDRLTIAADNLDKRAVEFRIRTEKCRDAVLEDFDKKMAELERNKARKLRLMEESRDRSELSLDKIRRQVESSRMDLMNRCNYRADEQRQQFRDGEEVDGFLELYRRSLETARLAEAWQVPPRLMEDEMMKMAAIGDGNERRSSSRENLLSERANAQRPGGMTRDRTSGEIYIACPGNGQIIVLDRHYRLLRRISNVSHMTSPQSVAVLDHEIYVSDKCQHSILVLDRRGQLIRRIGSKGSAPGQLRCPRGIALSTATNSTRLLYVADTGNDRVQIYDCRSGESLADIQPRGVDFDRPADVAVSSANSGLVCVADSGNHKIHVFEPRGRLVFSCGAYGSLDGLFRSPMAVEFGDEDDIYVGDCDNGRIQVFSAQGQFVRVVGSDRSSNNNNNAKRKFGWISGLICLPDEEGRRRLLVADSRENALYSLRS